MFVGVFQDVSSDWLPGTKQSEPQRGKDKGEGPLGAVPPTAGPPARRCADRRWQIHDGSPVAPKGDDWQPPEGMHVFARRCETPLGLPRNVW